MKKAYRSPLIVDHGSIANCTFTLSGLTRDQKRDGTAGAPIADGSWTCMYTGDLTREEKAGNKNWQELACDKFGEYSHPSTTVGS